MQASLLSLRIVYMVNSICTEIRKTGWLAAERDAIQKKPMKVRMMAYDAIIESLATLVDIKLRESRV